MTTNHPANGPVSLDRLHQIREILSKAAAQSDGGNLGYAMADAVKVIDGAIAARNAGKEPVAWVRYCSDGTIDGPLMNYQIEDCRKSTWTPLYAAPQLPQKAVADDIGEIRVGRLPTMNQDEYPGLGDWWVQLRIGENADEVLARVYGDTPREANNRAVALVSRAGMLQAGNSPVTPDGLVSCGENCWSCGKYFTYEQHSECDGYCPHCDSPVDLDDEEDEQSKSLPANPTEEMISNAWREALGKCDHETIRRMYVAMFAAAPQQEVQSAFEHGMQRYAGAMQKLSEGDK